MLFLVSLRCSQCNSYLVISLSFNICRVHVLLGLLSESKDPFSSPRPIQKNPRLLSMWLHWAISWVIKVGRKKLICRNCFVVNQCLVFCHIFFVYIYTFFYFLYCFYLSSRVFIQIQFKVREVSNDTMYRVLQRKFNLELVSLITLLYEFWDLAFPLYIIVAKVSWQNPPHSWCSRLWA